jgi:hypothetical protein
MRRITAVGGGRWWFTGALAIAFCGVPAAIAMVDLAAQAAGAPPAAPAGQQAPQAEQGRGEGRGEGRGAGRAGGRGGGGARGGARGGAPIPFEDRTGFKPIFNGTSLEGWDGDPTFWRAEGGAIVGESTAEKAVTENTFLIWRGGEPADFELKLEFRMNSTNSGVQYRSQQIQPGGPEKVSGKWVLKGYQADIDFNNQYTGMLYEERGRGFLAPRGTFGYVGPNQPAQGAARGQAAPAAAPATPPGPRGQLAQLADSETLRGFIKQNDWNQFHVIARGNILVHVLNGHVTALFLDDDAQNRSMKGLLGLQIHTGPPMKIEFRNVYLKTM